MLKDQNDVEEFGRSPFLELPKEIRLLIYSLCRTDRWLVATDNVHNEPYFGYGHSGCRKLQQINHQIRDEAFLIQPPDLSLQFAGRASFCQFLSGDWLSCPVTDQRYRGCRLGLKVSETAFRNVKVTKLAPGTVEVGYISLSNLSKWLPNLKRLELDLSREAMWAYHQDPNFPLEEVLIRDINWRLGTIFGVDASSLRQGREWTLVVHASFMLPANLTGRSSIAGVDIDGRLTVDYIVDSNGSNFEVR